MDTARRKQLLEASHLGRAVVRQDPAAFDAADQGGPFADQLRAALTQDKVDRVRLIASQVQQAMGQYTQATAPGNVNTAPLQLLAGPENANDAGRSLWAILRDACLVLNEAVED